MDFSAPKPAELETLLRLMRKHKVLAFEVGSLKVSFSPMALVEPKPVPSVLPELSEAPEEEDPDLNDESDLMWSAGI